MGERTEELKREIESTRSDLGDTLDAIGDRVSPGRVMERRKNRMNAGVRSVVDRVMGKAHDVAGTGHDVMGSAHDLPGSVRSQTQGTPLIAGAVAFAVGFIAASAIPPSEAEVAASGQLLERSGPVKAELSHVGHEIAEHLKEPAQEAVGEVKAAAQEGAQSVTDSAQQSKEDTVAQAHEAVATAKDQGGGRGRARRRPVAGAAGRQPPGRRRRPRPRGRAPHRGAGAGLA